MKIGYWVCLGVLLSGCGLTRDTDDVELNDGTNVNNYVNNLFNNTTAWTNNGTNNGTSNAGDMGTADMSPPDMAAVSYDMDGDADPLGVDTLSRTEATTSTGQVCPDPIPLAAESVCNPVDPGIGCPGQWCGVVYSDGLVIQCTNQTESAGSEGDACGQCLPGMVCHLAICRRYCERSTARGCLPDQFCNPKGGIQDLGLGLCTSNCD